MPISRFAAGLALLWLVACSGATEPVAVTLPEPDTSLDPAALVSPTLLYGCNSWNGAAPIEKELFVDIEFGRREADPADRPLLASIRAVERHGGQIVHRFNFPVARVWIATSELPALSREGAFSAVYRVTNLRRYDWPIFVGYVKPYTYTDGEPRFEQLGGRVGSRYSSFNAISGLIPDASVSALRREKGVDYVESAAGIGCLD